MTDDRNPQAFPFPERYKDDDTGELFVRQHLGLTLRDWFAGFAMQALTLELLKGAMHKGVTPEEGRAEIAKAVYQIADAMLLERAKEKP